MCGSHLFGQLHFWIVEPISSVLCLVAPPEVICVLKSQIKDICLLGTWREFLECFRLELPNVMQLHSFASRNRLFREYGSVFKTPGVSKNN